jgi:AraC-like DNA-binding protein
MMSTETLDEAMRLRAKGLVWTAIAKQLDVAPTTLHKHLSATGRITTSTLRKKVARWPKQVIRDAHRRCVSGEGIREVAATLGISAEALRTQFQRKGFPALTQPKRWSAKVIKAAYNSYLKGESRESIAARLDTTWNRLHRTFTRMGLKTRKIAARERMDERRDYKAWSLRMEGRPYKEVAELLGLKTRDPALSAACAVYRYCKRCGLPKPPRDIATSRAKRAG